MAEIPNLPAEEGMLPIVEDVVLADMSGFHGLDQDEMWRSLTTSTTGQLGAWALSEARVYQERGVAARDAFLSGVGYAVTALLRQAERGQDKEAVSALLASVFDAAEADDLSAL
jgi:hypothetical protein